jgi:hypothetical protein
VNNCRVPIVIRTFGVPDVSPVGEVGLLHNIIANPPVCYSRGHFHLSRKDCAKRISGNPGRACSSTASLNSCQSALIAGLG